MSPSPKQCIEEIRVADYIRAAFVDSIAAVGVAPAFEEVEPIMAERIEPAEEANYGRSGFNFFTETGA